MNYLDLLTLTIKLLFLAMFITYEIKTLINPQKVLDFSNKIISDFKNNKKISNKQKTTLVFQFIYFLWVMIGLFISKYWIFYFILLALSIFKAILDINPIKKFKIDAILSILTLTLITIYELKEIFL